MPHVMGFGALPGTVTRPIHANAFAPQLETSKHCLGPSSGTSACTGTPGAQPQLCYRVDTFR